MSLTYELAKRLKDADFPYNWDSFEYLLKEQKDNPHWHSTYLTPTLEELIDALGFDLDYLENMSMHSTQPFKWFAHQKPQGAMHIGICMGGNTPHEALAELYLKLKV